MPRHSSIQPRESVACRPLRIGCRPDTNGLFPRRLALSPNRPGVVDESRRIRSEIGLCRRRLESRVRPRGAQWLTRKSAPIHPVNAWCLPTARTANTAASTARRKGNRRSCVATASIQLVGNRSLANAVRHRCAIGSLPVNLNGHVHWWWRLPPADDVLRSPHARQSTLGQYGLVNFCRGRHRSSPSATACTNAS